MGRSLLHAWRTATTRKLFVRFAERHIRARWIQARLERGWAQIHAWGRMVPFDFADRIVRYGGVGCKTDMCFSRLGDALSSDAQRTYHQTSVPILADAGKPARMAIQGRVACGVAEGQPQAKEKCLLCMAPWKRRGYSK